ncbi:MAG: PIN domain-containing protein [Anaerolineae bacterium]|nr:PIN domain-containing protein [Anaerolineae bacterium]
MVDITAFMDSSVLIDILRQHLPAKTWMVDQMPNQLAVTPYVWMEVVFGAPDKVNQQRAEKMLAQFRLVYPTQADTDWSMRQLAAYSLSHSVGVLDCLIAAPAHRLKLPLYTTNVKHFAPLLGDAAVPPY